MDASWTEHLLVQVTDGASSVMNAAEEARSGTFDAMNQAAGSSSSSGSLGLPAVDGLEEMRRASMTSGTEAFSNVSKTVESMRMPDVPDKIKTMADSVPTIPTSDMPSVALPDGSSMMTAAEEARSGAIDAMNQAASDIPTVSLPGGIPVVPVVDVASMQASIENLEEMRRASMTSGAEALFDVSEAMGGMQIDAEALAWAWNQEQTVAKVSEPASDSMSQKSTINDFSDEREVGPSRGSGGGLPQQKGDATSDKGGTISQEAGMPVASIPTRFLVGCGGDEREAKRRWSITHQWRSENKVDDFLNHPPGARHILEIKKLYRHFFHK